MSSVVPIGVSSARGVGDDVTGVCGIVHSVKNVLKLSAIVVGGGCDTVIVVNSGVDKLADLVCCDAICPL